MSLSIVTFANLGKKRNLKTADIIPVIDTFIAKKELYQIICQINQNFYFSNTISATPLLIRYSVGALRRGLKISLPRKYVEAIFDMFAAYRLQKADVTLFHPALFSRTMAAARKKNSITLGIAAAAHPLFAKALYEQECQNLKIPVHSYLEAMDHRLVVDRFDYMITMSDLARDSYIEHGFSPDRIFVAMPDIDLQKFTPLNKNKQGQSTFRILYMAHTQVLKGLQYLLDAWEELSLPNAELVIVGGFSDMPDELKKRYEVRINKLHNIKWILGTEEPQQYYHEASVFVFPSLSEGFGRVTLEAMASGIPVITTENAKGIVEEGKTGFIVPIRDARAIREKIEYLYSNPALVKEMGKEARKAAEHKESFGESVYEIYQEILKRERKI
jgi:glycosyltransferase involved in cell wall biosynthesis